MKATEVRERTDDELRNMETDLQRELWRSQFDNHTNQLDDTSKIRKLRRDIARVKTILAERQRVAAEQKVSGAQKPSEGQE